MFCKDKSLIIFHLEAVSLAGIVEPYCRKTLKLYLDKRKNVNKLFNAKIFYASGWMNFVVCLLSLLTYVVSLCLLNKIYLDKVFLLPAFSCCLNLKSYKMITYYFASSKINRHSTKKYLKISTKLKEYYWCEYTIWVK